MKGYRGYLFSRPMGGNSIPQRVQNLVIREYAKKVNICFLPSAVEYSMPDCTMMLRSVLSNPDELEGMIFYNTHQLPQEQEERSVLYEKVKMGLWKIHFALEEIVLDNEATISNLEDLLATRRLSQSFNSMKGLI